MKKTVKKARTKADKASDALMCLATGVAEGKAIKKAQARPKAIKKVSANGKMSCLDAAAKVLEESGESMTTRAMFDAMVTKKYWTSEAPTPHNTLYSAILREITKKGDVSRFRKASRGKFALKK